ncbi:lytic transglycosylase domain-containing protein [Alicyclobacillus sp. ALC3]|uniref:lytic transglycosylase domain-containing protein n=1 Tax=Alicyclobacillus sp. ALC3 TaxID=2796143 RepID=UPI002379969E|nr:transglycosylase SLT domain-containing protein [Alicyclobacillus sp. ALC3]
MWVIKQMFLYLGCGGSLGYLALLIGALSLFGFLIGDYKSSGNGSVNGTNVTLDSATIAKNTELKLTYQHAADTWQPGLSPSQISQVEQQQVGTPPAVLLAIGKMINNLNPPNAYEYANDLKPSFTWQTFKDETITYHSHVNPKTGQTVCVQSVRYTPVTMLVRANTWDGTLSDTYHWVTSGHVGCNGVWTRHIELSSTKRTYTWSRVWSLFAHVPADNGGRHFFITKTKLNEQTLAGLIAAQDYSITDPHVQAMVATVLFPSGTGAFTGTAVGPASPNTIKNVARWKTYIEMAAAQYRIPAVLIAGVMSQESSGNEYSSSGGVLTSSTGAMGLMQIEPSTASGMYLNGTYIGNSVMADLSNPATNIQIGAMYLSELYHEFGNNPVEAESAYNAGPGGEQQALSQGYQVAQNAQTLNYVNQIQNRWVPALTKYFGPETLTPTGTSSTATLA